MYLTSVAIAAWLQNQNQLSIFAIAVSAIVAWPFAALLGVGIAIDIVPVILIDSHFYGKWVVAPLNIVLYNIFTEHGPDLYGVEPWYYYIINGFLNFNIAFPLAIISLPILFFSKLIVSADDTNRNVTAVLCFCLAPFYLWLTVFILQPHKEERFLFPIYTLICLSAAICIDHLQRLISWAKYGRKAIHYTQYILNKWFVIGLLMLHASGSVSRCFALYKNYQAPLHVYGDLMKVAHNSSLHPLSSYVQVNLCVGKEWYRFPSSFFLPENWKLMFVKSEFKGQLPKYFESENPTSSIPSHMNDMNLEEPTRYINVSKCHYLVDLDVPTESKLEPRYSLQTKQWKVLYSGDFLFSSGSSSLFRALYVPFLTSKKVKYIKYNLLQTTRLAKRRK
ncbi:DgyrCDS11006 [Dimorphilus gyrociliatus]|uniref:Mannosyltransferase n=1 Tax=Dimorphilus gyrociliatus TaxID=2664684 RepID=A0A7I8W337_9ANNE|nr:DgyrCDS11006 [Dimorphilus gyrociliatus]